MLSAQFVQILPFFKATQKDAMGYGGLIFKCSELLLSALLSCLRTEKTKQRQDWRRHTTDLRNCKYVVQYRGPS